jgi:hypothetical protein
MSIVHFAEKNIRGAWAVYGLLGVRQYYYYTKKEAIERYKAEYKNTHIERI